MFEKNLQDLVKGIRSNKRDVSGFISKCLAEIKTELRSNNQRLKSSSCLPKLVYLQMLGYDATWASFHIVEVMSQPMFLNINAWVILALNNVLPETDVILLCTNLLKKELHASNQYEIGLAINCLSNIVTKDLGRIY